MNVTELSIADKARDDWKRRALLAEDGLSALMEAAAPFVEVGVECGSRQNKDHHRLWWYLAQNPPARKVFVRDIIRLADVANGHAVRLGMLHGRDGDAS